MKGIDDMGGKISNRLLAGAILTLAPSLALADRPASHSVTIPISVYLTPDPQSTRNEAIDCIARARDAASGKQQACRDGGRVLYTSTHYTSYTSANKGDVMVTISAI